MTASRTSILLVDDNPSNLKVLQTLLTTEGYHVRVANCGSRALTAAAMSPPSLILLDIRMPEMDGYEVCRRLKADPATRDIPVIFLSVAKEPIDKVKAFSVGGVDYITKPFDTEEVLARVKTHVTLHDLQHDLEQQVQQRTSELREANAQLREEMAERVKLIAKLESQNAELERFTYTVSHELKTPLITINWVTGAMQEDLAKSIRDRFGQVWNKG